MRSHKNPNDYLLIQGCSKKENSQIKISNCYGTLTFQTRKEAEDFLNTHPEVNVIKPQGV